jgi:murein DD-endopeptidase MepM/ murein hydrolase activator NlpD
MALVFAALIGVNVYIFVARPKTSLRELMKRSELAKQGASAAITPEEPTPPAPMPPKPKPVVDEDDARTAFGVVGEGETLPSALEAAGLGAREVNDLVATLDRARAGQPAPSGESFTLRYDAEEHLRGVEVRESANLAYRLERTPTGYTATRDDRATQVKLVELGGIVGSSLFDAIKRNGEQPALAQAFVDLFAGDVAFYTDAQPTDRYRIIVEKRVAAGKLVRYGRILAAEYQGRAGSTRAFWFQPQDGSPGGYFTEHGESADKLATRSPLRYVRVPATFDRHRFHPVPHVEHGLAGHDFGAPTGTPVWAEVSGRVTFVGPRPGAGLTVTVTQPGGVEVDYAHLGRLARGLRAGLAVRQKQVVGYVGNVAGGLPHVHVTVKLGGQIVDALKLKASRGEPLDGRHRLEFADFVAARLTALAAIETRDRTAALP